MPTYTFRNKTTNETFDELVPSNDIDAYMQANPELERILKFPGIVSGVDAKPDNGFRDVLKRIKNANIRSTIDTF